MIKRTFLDKSTTIIKDTTNNYGLHPISMLNYGNLLSRFIVHFNIDELREKVEDKTFIDTSKLKHILKMKNCGSINPEKHKEKLTSADINGIKERATSFTVIAFELPQEFDEGIGFDNANDFWLVGKSAESTDGCTWYNATNEETWGEEGIYSTETLIKEYDNFKNGKNSIIIAEQHFDHGNENLELDLTNYVNNLISNSGATNNGICIAFSPYTEVLKPRYTQYVGFFNNKTNTIYHPVLETTYNCDIQDDRYTFVLNKNNKLYLFSLIDGKLENLDELPTCTISDGGESGTTSEVTQESKGVYSTELKLSSKEYHKDMILYDIWSNIKYNGEEIDDVEMEFVTHPSKLHFGIGENHAFPKQVNPIIVGMNDNEKINRGEIRQIKVFFKIPYTQNEFKLVDNCWYRLYVKDGDREVDIINWDKILKISHNNLFVINTNELVPTEYHLDIKAEVGEDIRIFKDELTFKIISNITDERI